MTDPSYPQRRGRVGTILLALLFLAVLGGAVGYLVGHQVKLHREESATGGDTPPPTTDGPGPAPSASLLPGTHCPAASEKTAGRQLIEVFYLRTNRSRVWICRDSDNGLYYQGLTGGSDVFTDTNSVLVPDVTDEGDRTYEATNHASNGTWKYTVTKKSLVITKTGGATSTEPAVTSSPG